ncbi:hypothetical protein NECAME_11038 [Necator americanus]|uniref:Uncharacterized protein n=1 Tax=Necator americanus TaxID=51031 RepID=W2T8C8_NECAM|nr:hypothetical protein NECAME_11038 [Necator americanus]ETN77441.1 hypothetical protein NECAME_11038 [Necator americanus]
MKWNHPQAVHGVEHADVPQFTITGFQTEDRVELHQSTSDPRTHDLNSTSAAAAPPPKNRQRPTSPIQSLCPSGSNGLDDTPDYPRYTTVIQGIKPRQSLSARTRRRLRMTKMRAVSMKTSLHRIGKRARKAIPTIRVRDLNS